MARPNEIRAFDLFCGAGGSSWGAKQAGATPVGGVDLWELAARTYQANFRSAKTYCTDLAQLSPHDVARELGRIDLLIASPECTHHSVAKGSGPRDEASRRLAYEVLRFAGVLQPRWIVVENVIQMETWHSFSEWHQCLHSLGYQTKVLKLDAERFGAAQKRKRLFVLCDGEREPPDPRSYRRTDKTVESILQETDGDGKPWVFTPLENGRRAKATIERARRAITALGPERQFILVYYGSDGAGGFQTLDRPLRTITTLDRFALVRPNGKGHEMRMLQPPELAAAMGFPLEHKWPAISRRDKIKLIGTLPLLFSVQLACLA